MTETFPPNEWGLVVLCRNCQKQLRVQPSLEDFQLKCDECGHYYTYKSSDIQWTQLQKSD